MRVTFGRMSVVLDKNSTLLWSVIVGLSYPLNKGMDKLTKQINDLNLKQRRRIIRRRRLRPKFPIVMQCIDKIGINQLIHLEVPIIVPHLNPIASNSVIYVFARLCKI